MNADIRKHCDEELAEQGFLAIAPDLFWRQEPVRRSRCYLRCRTGRMAFACTGAYDRNAGANDVTDTVNAVRSQPRGECNGKVALLGYCLRRADGLPDSCAPIRVWTPRSLITAAIPKNYLGEVDGLRAPILMHLAEEDEFHFQAAAQAQIKAALAGKPSATVCSYPGQHHAFARHNGAHYDVPRRRRSPMAEQPNFSIANCGDVRSRQGAISRKEGQRIEWTADISR